MSIVSKFLSRSNLEWASIIIGFADVAKWAGVPADQNTRVLDYWTTRLLDYWTTTKLLDHKVFCFFHRALFSFTARRASYYYYYYYYYYYSTRRLY